jgi:arabinogalactan oligomer/maltooligosaccharide transport system substrate-binding protein
MRKTICAGLIAAVTGALLLSTAPVANASTTLTLWTTTNDTETPTLQTVVKGFEKANPGVTVKVVSVPFGDRDAKFSAAVQANKAPDVMRAEIADVALWASKGFLKDVTSAVPKSLISQYLPSAMAYYQWNNKVWGMPNAPDALAVLYNKDLFAKAGITTFPKSLAELKSVCEAKFPNANGIFLRGDAYWVQPWVWGYGGGLIDPAKKQILIADKKSVAGLEAYQALFASKCAVPNKDFANDYGNSMEAFKSGKVAMIVNGPWSTADALSGTAFNNDKNKLGVGVIPAGPGGQGSPVGGNGWVVSRNTKNADAAVKLMQYLAGPQANQAFAVNNNLLPALVKSYSAPAVKANPVIAAFLPQMKVATARPVVPQGGQIYTAFGPAVQDYLSGKATAQAALDSVAQQWKSKLFPSYSITK